MKNLTLGQTTAAELGTDIFNANFGANPPTPTVTFPLDASSDQQVKVTATANVHTLFMQYLQQWASVPVGATAVATRGKLVMSIVLDRSGSMCGGTEHCDTGVTGDNGGEALKAAVPLFVGNFDNSATGDELAMGSFSSNATVDYTINYNFKTADHQCGQRPEFHRRHIRHGSRNRTNPKQYYGGAALARPSTKRQRSHTTGAERSQSCRVFHGRLDEHHSGQDSLRRYNRSDFNAHQLWRA